jgi:transcriptional regulator GlxA family with amidase domain
MHIAILTFQGFNELDSFIALGVLNRIKKPGRRVTICCPEPTVTSMNGVTVHAQSTLAEARSADAAIVGSGIRTREIVGEPAIMNELQLDPVRQLIRLCRAGDEGDFAVPLKLNPAAARSAPRSSPSWR